MILSLQLTVTLLLWAWDLGLFWTSRTTGSWLAMFASSLNREDLHIGNGIYTRYMVSKSPLYMKFLENWAACLQPHSGLIPDSRMDVYFFSLNELIVLLSLAFVSRNFIFFIYEVSLKEI
jgi:hypothetical protein